MTETGNSKRESSARRASLKPTSALMGGAMLSDNARSARPAHINGSDEIKIALIGCGGRGIGAATQALATKGKVTLWAAADAFEDNVKAALDSIKNDVDRGKRDGD